MDLRNSWVCHWRKRGLHLKYLLCWLVFPLLLTGCQGEGTSSVTEEELALSIRAKYLSMTACTATAEVRADYGQRVYDYTIALSYDQTTGTQMTLLAPGLVAGVTAHVSTDSTLLEYEGVQIETGRLDDEGLSPVSGVPLLLETVKHGFLAELSQETLDDQLCLRLCSRSPEYQAGTGREVVLWLDWETGCLLQGEIFEQGQLVISCQFTEFTMESTATES